MRLLQKISRNIIARNLVLAFCAVMVFAGLSALALNLFTRHSQREPVPDFIGINIAEVEQMAGREGLRLEVIDSIYAPMYGGGAVIEQLPASGTEVKKGRRIFVTITSHQQKMVPVPFVTGFSLRQAKNMIEMAGLEIGELRYVSNIATGNVLAELIGRDTVRRNSGRQLEVGSGVTLVVGKAEDAAWVDIPKVVGLTLGEAKSRLWERGFNVGEVRRDEGINLINQKDAGVYRQSPAYGRTAALGTRISISLTLDEDKVTQGSTAVDREARQAIHEREAQRALEAAMDAGAAAMEEASSTPDITE
ncbi:MAG: PASTA domain-containing protein [Alistipes sp.]|jgi:beta-lactam-binding protein with PASTA domain|nr:PASTA domain-containing protein [Alistipes sp.]